MSSSRRGSTSTSTLISVRTKGGRRGGQSDISGEVMTVSSCLIMLRTDRSQQAEQTLTTDEIHLEEVSWQYTHRLENSLYTHMTYIFCN